MIDLASLFKNTKRITGLVPVFCAIFFLTSCNPQMVLVVSDPYVHIVNDGKWVPESWLFYFKARLSGFGIVRTRTEPGVELSHILAEKGESADIVILSPWNAQFLETVPETDGRFIIAGGYPPANVPEWIIPRLQAVVPERSLIMEELGELSAQYAQTTEKPVLALFDAETEAQQKDRDRLLDAFDVADSLVYKKINRTMHSNEAQFPEDFATLAEEASLLLLFAGPLNITGFSESEEASIPVITESMGGSLAWHERIVASVEDNPAALATVLLEEMMSESSERIIYYPASLSKGVLFGILSR